MTLEILDQRRRMLSPVEFFQDEHAKERVHLVVCRSRVTVVCVISEICQRTTLSTDSWQSCLKQVCETVRISDSSPSSELRSYNGVESETGHSMCE